VALLRAKLRRLEAANDHANRAWFAWKGRRHARVRLHARAGGRCQSARARARPGKAGGAVARGGEAGLRPAPRAQSPGGGGGGAGAVVPQPPPAQRKAARARHRTAAAFVEGF
jgi:hypothetical protein